VKPRMLDAYCCAGGATRGYQSAGFHVTGIDINPQPNYCGDEFVQGDAIEFIREHGHEFDFIASSPPCQEGCTLTAGTNKGRVYPQLIPATRDALKATGRPWLIENPPGKAPMRRDLMLCGEMFDLAVIRHRNFELDGITVPQPKHRRHRGRVAGMRHGEWFQGPYFAVYGDGGGKGTVAEWQRAMGIDWTDVRKEIAEAIPPAYALHIGRAVMAQLGASVEAVAS
jgi:hypothetical protein